MRSMFVTGLMLVALRRAWPGLAQQAALEEIVVTATRREERAAGGRELRDGFLGEDLQALRRASSPGPRRADAGAARQVRAQRPGNGRFYLRGVGINDFTGTVDPSVGMYVDEVFQPTPDMLNFAVYDIERVEVLRGPQGTLYGRNSTGGAINFITARPTEDSKALSAPATAATTRSRGRRLERPAIRHAARPAVGERHQRFGSDGYSFNRFTNNDLGKIESLAARGQLEWRPSEDFSLRLMYNYGDSESEQALLQHVGTRDPANPGALCAPVIAGRVDEGACVDLLGYSDDDGDIYDGASERRSGADLRSDDVTLTMNWNSRQRDADLDQRLCGFLQAPEPGHRRLAECGRRQLHVQ